MVKWKERDRGGEYMLITLFAFEIILMILTMFTTHMVEHKFEGIRVSLGMYCSKRAYKTKADIDFIETIINEYKRLCSDTDEEPDLPSAISLKLHKEYIGRFTYVSIKNIAIKVRYLMWGIVGIEILIAGINKTFYTTVTLVIIFLSLLLTLAMCFYGIIKGLNEKQETLIDEVTHYIKNVYPLEVQKQKKAAEVISLEKRRREEAKQEAKQEESNQSHKLDCIKEQESNIKEKEKKKEMNQSSGLSAQDIEQFLKNL